MSWIKHAIVADLWVVPEVFPDQAFDVDLWVGKLREMGFSALRLGASAGSRCWYDSSLIKKDEELGDRDLLKEWTDACRKYGLKSIACLQICYGMCSAAQVIGGESVHDCYHHVLDWSELSPEGKPTYDFVFSTFSCPNNPIYKSLMFKLVDEIQEKYAPDAIYFDGPRYFSICRCRHCIESFKEEAGYELPDHWPPTDEDYGDPVWRACIEWRYRTVEGFVKELVSHTKAKRDMPVYVNFNVPERDFWARWSTNTFQFAKYADGILVENELLTDGLATIRSGMRIKMARSEGAVPLVYTEPQVWGYPVPSTPAAEFGVLAAEVMANGGTVLVWPTLNVCWDSSGYEGLKEIFAFRRDKKGYFEKCAPVKYICLPYSEQTAEFYGRADAHVYERYNRGFIGAYQALVDDHIQVDCILEDRLTEEDLRDYELVILSNYACMSEAQVEAIRSYVARGGKLIATFETSLFDEYGRKREDFALSDLFDCRYVDTWRLENAGGQHGRMSPRKRGVGTIDFMVTALAEGKACTMVDDNSDGNPYIKFSVDDPLAKELGIKPLDPEVGVNVPITKYTIVESAGQTVGRIRERKMAGRGLVLGPETEHPDIVRHRFGDGEVIYITADIGNAYYKRGFSAQRKLLDKLIREISAPPFEIEAPTSVEAVLWEGERKGLFCLVNHTRTPSFRRYLSDYTPPLYDLPVTIKTRKVATAAKVYPGEQGAEFKQDEEAIRFTIRELAEYAFITLEYA